MTINSASPFSVEDFESSDWQEAFKGKKNSAFISRALQKLTMKAIDEGKVAQSKVLQILANVCSMTLRPMSVNEPFHPYQVTRTGRSSSSEDFVEADIDYFQQILPSVNEAWLKARLADLVWLRRRRQTDLGLIAIDAYIETPLTQDSVIDEGGHHWIRALRLVRMLKKISGDREKVIETKLLNALYSSTEANGFLGRWLADILISFDLAKDKEVEVADKLISLAQGFVTQKDYHRARGYYEAAYDWLQKARKEEEAFKIRAALAETWNEEALLKETNKDFVGVSHCLEKAIQAYRQIPQKYREPFGIVNKLSELQVYLNKMGSQASASLTLVSTPAVDVSEMIIQAQEAVKEKSSVEALTILANLYKGVDVKELRDKAKQTLNVFHLSTFFPKTILSRDGRVIAKRPGIIDATDDSEVYELAVLHEMIQHYLLEISVVVGGRIVPALEIMILEHRLTEDFFVSLSSRSAIIPPERSRAFGKALFAGYDLDFDSVIHRLVPQMEEMVRYHLKSIGVLTSVVNQQGIEEEVNLGTLLEKPEAIKIFGEDRVFEMNALFCEKTGPKFRHGIAHGLLEDRDFDSAPAIYVWCFALKLALTPFWNSLTRI